jgi:hypothetical protein
MEIYHSCDSIYPDLAFLQIRARILFAWGLQKKEIIIMFVKYSLLKRLSISTLGLGLYIMFSMTASVQANFLAILNDEFNNAATLAEWLRLYQIESWNADQLESWDIDTTQQGRMVLMPHTSTWFQDYKGAMVFKYVPGDFVVTVQVQVTDRDLTDDNEIPESSLGAPFSLAGIMIRTPRAITDPSVHWSPGGENYVFISIGNGNSPTVSPSFQFEEKTTGNSISNLSLLNTTSGIAKLQIARIGNAVITLYQPAGQNWAVFRRHDRSDMPNLLQVGMVAYTEWNRANDFTPFNHNRTVITENDNPDLIAGFEYIHFFEPTVPPELDGLDLTNPEQVSEADLLGFLGVNADIPFSACVGDLNNDGVVDGQDLADFANDFGRIDCSVP